MSQSGDSLYRKEALDRLSSPEQLDEMISISSTGAWAGLIGILLLAATFVAWAILGAIPTRIEGQGMLFSGGGQVVDAVSLASGTLSTAGYSIGQHVPRGAVLAEIEQPEVVLQLAAARERVVALSDALNVLEGEQARLSSARASNAEARRAAYVDQVAAAGQRQEAYAARLEAQERLAASGNAANATVQQVREQLASANQDLASARAGLLTIDADLLAAQAVEQRDLRNSQQQLAAAQAEVAQLTLQNDQFGKVVSPVDGVLVEWKAPFGTQAGAGRPVASVASGEGQLQFMLYVPPGEAKRITTGMTVNVELEGFKKEQWGTLVGEVVSVSPFPATPEGILAVTQNTTLVGKFSQGGAPFAVVVQLIPDPSSPSGYQWSGGSGATTPLSAGTLGGGKVTVETRSPLSFVLPFLRQAGGA
ncbi:NHLP bacteriocin system secretion protein [Devosia sp. Leaf64]|uniref:NHLP bacteriocin system secretion protein n=1 Tax=Devosia sp. Leaf64 TaxID=1736229 RepID=UPI000714B6A0|nr:NHLP bacteriocin system secretion protein [Devosia sp. Leaf64]KQN78276.1 hypothetical protein ASE94_14935 [Devosia sp. Leaf64]